MAWTLLLLAGALEIAFAFAMKASYGFTRLIPAVITVATGISSVVLLSLSLKSLPVGTGYAVWTGIGGAGVAILGMIFLGEFCGAAPADLPCPHPPRHYRTEVSLWNVVDCFPRSMTGVFRRCNFQHEHPVNRIRQNAMRTAAAFLMN